MCVCVSGCKRRPANRVEPHTLTVVEAKAKKILCLSFLSLTHAFTLSRFSAVVAEQTSTKGQEATRDPRSA